MERFQSSATTDNWCDARMRKMKKSKERKKKSFKLCVEVRIYNVVEGIECEPVGSRDENEEEEKHCRIGSEKEEEIILNPF